MHQECKGWARYEQSGQSRTFPCLKVKGPEHAR